jgi:hypothetical protein
MGTQHHPVSTQFEPYVTAPRLSTRSTPGGTHVRFPLMVGLMMVVVLLLFAFAVR